MGLGDNLRAETMERQCGHLRECVAMTFNASKISYGVLVRPVQEAMSNSEG